MTQLPPTHSSVSSDSSLHVDGGIHTDPRMFNFSSPRGKGYAKVNHSSSERIEIPLPLNTNTNIEAEIHAIFCGITECIRTKKKIIITDSKFWVDAINKGWKLKEPRIQLSCQICRSLLSHYGLILSWVKREENMAT